MTKIRKLIVSADDFGMSPGVNAGIVRGHRDGILTNAGLMVNGEAFEEAVAIARENPDLGVGLHLVLVQGHATSPPQAVPDLVDSTGRFREHPIACGLRYFFQPGIRAQLEQEIRAQLEKFLATGLPLSHVDGHLNIHMHPAVLSILLELAGELGVRAMRLSREALAPALRFDARDALRKGFETVAFNGLAANAAPKLRAAGIRHPDHMRGLHQTGRIDEAYFEHTVADLPEGTTEIYCHAAIVDAEAARWRPPDYRSDDELAALTSIRVRETLEAAKVELINYHHLEGAAAETADED